MDNMLEGIKDGMKDNQYSDYYARIESIIVERWEKMSIPLHCLRFAFNPRFYDKDYLEKLASGGIPWKAPNLDKEVVVGSNASRTLFDGIESNGWVTMDSIDWWSTYGFETPDLAEVAKKVLSQPISSSSAKRNWSSYSYIHNVMRNRLNCKRAIKLVFIYSNIRLISHFPEAYKSGPLKKWDINPESTFLEGSSSRFEEMQSEDLDDDDCVDNERKEAESRVVKCFGLLDYDLACFGLRN
ncbi:hypothetical protein OSB04_029978 [Centaurea solstitialis]|uniref:HAT C-terminal dimerisation domain-containing protein n=1 Tax=Centaurea solstitialis TaxID=347529 RepID=A0AA38W3D7_9ASTR|nr:hypothetical protein OSB04_029978 [Centaurea solstitialis]